MSPQKKQLAPWEVRREVRSALAKVRNAMLTARWDRALEGATEKQKKDAAMLFMRVQSAYLRVGNAELADIRDAIEEHQEELLEGVASLKGAVRNLGQVKQFIDTTTKFIGFMARLAALVA